MSIADLIQAEKSIGQKRVLQVLRKKGDVNLFHYAHQKGYKYTWVKYKFYLSDPTYDKLSSQFIAELNNDLRDRCKKLKETNAFYKSIFAKMKTDRKMLESKGESFDKIYSYMIKTYFK